MSGYETSCPSCGAVLVFELGSSLLRVCDHCGVAVARRGVDLKSYGRVAELIPTPSVLALGTRGHYEGAPRFSLAGRLQLDYGEGTWDEWLMAFEGDTWAWLSESQGKFHYLGQATLPPAPAFGDLSPGQTLDLGPPGTFVVTEVRSARFMSARGELPFDIEPGSLLNYADLSGPGGQFATLDYGGGSTAEALYVGREVSLEEVGIKAIVPEGERVKRVGSEALSCPKCGGPLQIHAPDKTRRVACPYCGSLLDATNDLAILEVLESPAAKPLIPLGSKGRFAGADWTLIGFMERSVTIEETRYPWHEYLLYEPHRGFRWLVESNGHWSFVEPANPGDVRADHPDRRVSYRDTVYKQFQSGIARVDHVVGEFYWAVARGDLTATADYVHSPYMLSKEEETDDSQAGRAKELNWSLGVYLTPEQVQEAFHLPRPPTQPVGIAPNQPWPWRDGALGVYRLTPLYLALLLLVFFGFAISGMKRVHTEDFSIPATAVSGAPESAVFTQPFEVKAGGNLEASVLAPVDNSWLYLDGVLINEETGEVDEFDLEASYYYGRDSDGSWSEGTKRPSTYIGSVRPGRYVMRLAPQWEAGRNPGTFTLILRSRVPRFRYAFFGALAILAWPAILGWRQLRFETRRWSESDHPIFESS